MRKSILAVGLLAVAAWPLGTGPLGPEQARPTLRAQGPAKAKAPAEPLVEQVREAIRKGIAYLRKQQTNSGSWNGGPPRHPEGATSLAVLALLNAGVPPTDEMITRGLEYLRKKDRLTTYVRSLQTLAFVEAGFPEDDVRIQQNIKRLLEIRIVRGGKLEGWPYDYTDSPVKTGPDNSNTQYAVLALHAARTKVKIGKEVWEEIRDYYERTQHEDGSWDYAPYRKAEFNREAPSLPMTTAGLYGLLTAGMESKQGRETLRANGTAVNCGKYKENPAIQKALNWISSPARDRFRLENNKSTFYNLYGIERAGRLSGLRFFHSHDWYREGCAYLVKLQQPEDGCWQLPGGYGWDSWPTVSTSFALLFLSKGRTPVLISKLVHGDPQTRQTTDLDWNNDRNDCRHLVEFASAKLFDPRKHRGLRLPLAWQTFDMLRATQNRPGAAFTDQDALEVTSDLLESPVVYFNGHESPLNRFTGREKELLKLYVENGGFVLAEACCGRAEFDKGFRALCGQLWPDVPLEPLPADHPVWRAAFVVPPGSFKLHGLQMGCKTVLIYSPEDLSCLWEQGTQDTARGELAFRVGTNIIAYATGNEPPRPRLSRVQLENVKDEARDVQRGFLKVAQLELEGDPQPAKRAMPRLMAYLNRRAGVDVVLKTEMLPPYVPSIKDFKFVYMHGRKDFMQERDYSEKELEHLRFNLEHGGLLLADACCGKEPFNRSFRRFVARLLPKHKLEPVDPKQELGERGLFSKKLNGEALTEQNIFCRVKRGELPRPMAPALEGVKMNGRWVVLYSRYDIGCALERHTSADCLGYSPESAEKIAAAAVLYTLRP
jgi:hypothetical protein